MKGRREAHVDHDLMDLRPSQRSDFILKVCEALLISHPLGLCIIDRLSRLVGCGLLHTIFCDTAVADGILVLGVCNSHARRPFRCSSVWCLIRSRSMMSACRVDDHEVNSPVSQFCIDFRTKCFLASRKITPHSLHVRTFVLL